MPKRPYSNNSFQYDETTFQQKGLEKYAHYSASQKAMVTAFVNGNRPEYLALKKAFLNAAKTGWKKWDTDKAKTNATLNYKDLDQRTIDSVNFVKEQVRRALNNGKTSMQINQMLLALDVMYYSLGIPLPGTPSYEKGTLPNLGALKCDLVSFPLSPQESIGIECSEEDSCLAHWWTLKTAAGKKELVVYRGSFGDYLNPEYKMANGKQVIIVREGNGLFTPNGGVGVPTPSVTNTRTNAATTPPSVNAAVGHVIIEGKNAGNAPITVDFDRDRSNNITNLTITQIEAGGIQRKRPSEVLSIQDPKTGAKIYVPVSQVENIHSGYTEEPYTIRVKLRPGTRIIDPQDNKFYNPENILFELRGPVPNVSAAAYNKAGVIAPPTQHTMQPVAAVPARIENTQTQPAKAPTRTVVKANVGVNPPQYEKLKMECEKIWRNIWLEHERRLQGFQAKYNELLRLCPEASLVKYMQEITDKENQSLRKKQFIFIKQKVREALDARKTPEQINQMLQDLHHIYQGLGYPLPGVPTYRKTHLWRARVDVANFRKGTYEDPEMPCDAVEFSSTTTNKDGTKQRVTIGIDCNSPETYGGKDPEYWWQVTVDFPKNAEEIERCKESGCLAKFAYYRGFLNFKPHYNSGRSVPYKEVVDNKPVQFHDNKPLPISDTSTMAPRSATQYIKQGYVPSRTYTVVQSLANTPQLQVQYGSGYGPQSQMQYVPRYPVPSQNKAISLSSLSYPVVLHPQLTTVFSGAYPAGSKTVLYPPNVGYASKQTPVQYVMPSSKGRY